MVDSSGFVVRTLIWRSDPSAEYEHLDVITELLSPPSADITTRDTRVPLEANDSSSSNVCVASPTDFRGLGMESVIEYICLDFSSPMAEVKEAKKGDDLVRSVVAWSRLHFEVGGVESGELGREETSRESWPESTSPAASLQAVRRASRADVPGSKAGVVSLGKSSRLLIIRGRHEGGREGAPMRVRGTAGIENNKISSRDTIIASFFSREKIRQEGGGKGNELTIFTKRIWCTCMFCQKIDAGGQKKRHFVD